jgi:hypothetical protein
MPQSVDPEFFFINQINEIQIKAGRNEDIQNVQRHPDVVLAVILYKRSQSVHKKSDGLEKEEDDQEFIDRPGCLQVHIGENVRQTNEPRNSRRQVKN